MRHQEHGCRRAAGGRGRLPELAGLWSYLTGTDQSTQVPPPAHPARRYPAVLWCSSRSPWLASQVGDQPVNRQSVHDEMERTRGTLQTLLSSATPADLRRGTDGTKWTNHQLLYHMVFGYLIVLSLLRLVRMFGRLPDSYSSLFAKALNSATPPFHLVNYLGSCGGATVFRGPRLSRQMDRTIRSLHRHLDRETDASLARSMHFPVGWDPFFRDRMTLLDVYHYGTQHFDFHQRQLTLLPPE